MALRAWASLARLDELKLIPRGACFSLPAGRQPGLGPRATKGDEARPAMFFNRAVLFWIHFAGDLFSRSPTDWSSFCRSASETVGSLL